MVLGKSKDLRRKSRSVLSKKVREKGRLPLSQLLIKYSVGESVVIDINPSVHKGMPHKRFQGKVGVIVGRRGTAHLIEIPQKKTVKTLIATQEHFFKHNNNFRLF